MCKQCQIGKMTKSRFKSKPYSSNDVLDLVHIDIFGPMKVKSYYCDGYFILFVDDYSRMMSMMVLKEKYDEFKMFKWYKERFEKQIGKKFKYLRYGKGGKFIYEELTIF